MIQPRFISTKEISMKIIVWYQCKTAHAFFVICFFVAENWTTITIKLPWFLIYSNTAQKKLDIKFHFIFICNLGKLYGFLGTVLYLLLWRHMLADCFKKLICSTGKHPSSLIFFDEFYWNFFLQSNWHFKKIPLQN